MHDQLGLLFASVNVVFSFLGFVLVLTGIRRFKAGLIAKSLKKKEPPNEDFTESSEAFRRESHSSFSSLQRH